MDNITIDFLFARALQLLNQAIILLIAAATVVFFWGIIQYVLSQGDEKKLGEGRRYMLYGIVGLAVMVAMWGFVNLLIVTIFGTETAGDPFTFEIPEIGTQ